MKCPSIPVVRKCCFCVPVRKAVIIFGYINLVLTLLAFPVLLFVLIEEATSTEYHPLHAQAHDPYALAYLLIDIIMYIFLIVAAHKRNTFALKSYLYTNLMFQLITLAVDLVYFDFQDMMEIAVYFIFLSLNMILLFLVHSTVRVIEESSAHCAQQNLRYLLK